MLSMKGVKIYGLYQDLSLVNPPPSSWRSDPKFQITIKYGNETKSSTKSKAKKGYADGDSCVVWNESFTFPGDIMDDSQLTFTAIRCAQPISKTIGFSKRLVTDLLKIQDDSGSCKLDIAEKCYLTFNIESSSDVVPEVVDEASVASTHLTNLQVPAEAANFVTSAVQFYDNQEKVWSSFLLQFQVFMKLTDDVSEISPYVKIAWSILSVIPKTIITQKNRDDKVLQLCEKMKDIYDYVTDAKRLPELSTTQRKTLPVLVQQTIECAYFIRAYSAENTVKNMVKGAIMDNKIQGFDDKFDHLKQVMTDSVNLETSIVTLRVSEGINEQNDSTLLDGMPYDSDAGFIPKKRCLTGTRQTLIDKILAWVNSEISPQILVLSGQAGTGKSAVAHTIAGIFREQKRLGSIFCFNRSYKDRRNYLFSTMARNLADGDVMWRKELVKVIKNAADIRKSKDPQIQFEELIVKPSRSVTTIGSIVIVVDALDESGDRGERKEILDLLFDRFSELPMNYRIIVTSRPERDIELRCQNPGPGVLCIRMGNINSEETYSDIKTYISSFLSPISSSLDKIDGHWCEILTKRAGGLFQWARTACEFINPTLERSQLIEKNWKTCISESSSSLSFSSLYRLYHQIISGQLESEDPDFIEDFKTVIGAIIMAREPLSIDALQNIFPNIEDIVSILSPFGSLFAGVHDSSTPVRPLHASLFDFFTTATKNHSYYVITSDQSCMTRACLRLMNRMLCFNICQLETSHRFNRDVPQFDSRVREAVPPHLDYSCRFWVLHLRFSPREEELIREIRYFMDHKLLYWFEVLGLLGTAGQGWVAMQILKNWCTDVDKDLAADALDAYDFGYDFEEVMTDNTPHLYLSALPFTPPNSFISKTYLSAYPGLFTFDIGPPAHSSPRIGITRRFHGDPTSLAFDPKGKYIATGTDSGEFMMWDYTTGELAHAYNKGMSSSSMTQIRDVVFSPDGELVYCCFENGNILVLDTRTNETHIESYAEMMGDQSQCLSFTISSNGCFLALWMKNGAFLYDRRNRSIIEQFDGSLATVRYPPTFSPNGEFFAFGINHQLCVRNIIRETPDIVLKPPFAEPNGQAVLSDSYVAFVGDFSPFIEVWDVRTSTKVTEIRHKSASATWYMAFSPENRYILSSSGSTYFVWNMWTGELISESTVDHAIYCLEFSHDCKSIALGTRNGSINVRQWDTSIQPGSHADVDDHFVLEVVLRDTYLIFVYRDFLQHGIQISDITTLNTIIFEAELMEEGLITVSPHQEGSDVHVAYITSRGLCLWDKTTKCEITVYESTHRITALASSNKYLVSAHIDHSPNEGIIKIWDIYTHDLVGGPYTISGLVKELCVSATSINFMVAYYVDNYCRLEVRQCESGHIIGGPFEMSYPIFYSHQLAFSPDETRIISIDKSVKIIDVSTGRREKLQQAVRIGIDSLSPNGIYLARIDDDDRVKLLDTDTGMSPLNISLSLDFGPIYGLVFSNDSKKIIITSGVDDSETGWDSEVSVWDIQSGKMIVKLPFFRADPEYHIRIHDLNLRNGYLVMNTHGSLTILDMNACEKIPTLYGTHRNDQQPVDFTLKGGWWSTSRTEVLDYALMAWKKASIPAFAKPHRYDGWVRGLKKELLLWIPQKRRSGFWSPCAMHVPYRNITKLNFDNFVHGTRWTECRDEIST